MVRRLGSLAAVFFLLLPACGTVDLLRRPSPLPETEAQSVLEQPVPPSPKMQLSPRAKIQSLLEAREYRSALSVVREQIAKGIPEPALAEEYGAALNGLLSEAEQFREQGKAGKAGALFGTVRENFPRSEEAAAKVKLSPSDIEERIAESTEQLMERGLIAYRAGDLDAAIRAWKTIQSFDPQHQASEKALETAEVQRSNLMKSPSP